MRYKPRITRAIALAALLCSVISLYASYTVRTNRSQDSQRSDDKKDVAPLRNVQTLWSHWSKIFHDVRPKTGPIQLSGSASLVGLDPGENGAREPAMDMIENNEADIESLRASHATLLQALKSEQLADNIYNGTGVVVVGGGEYFGPAIVGLHMLRKTGSTLPVEIFVADQKEYEGPLCEDYLPRYGARCLVLTHFLQTGGLGQTFEVTHYQLKSLAMLFSSFAEVLYLDSDSIPIVNPAKLFSAEPYISRGLVIWPDFWIATESPQFYAIAGIPFPADLPMTSSEAGQLMINKRTHLKSLLLAIYYNIYGPDYYYPLLSQGVLGQGDKETFMAAALVAGQPYYRVKTGVVSIGRNNGKEHKGSGMVQHHPADDFSQSEGNQKVVRPAFMHANTPKMNAGHLVDEGDLFTIEQKRLRLWGPREDQEKRFDCDLEKLVWEVLVQTGCELEQSLGEWKGRDRLCGRLEDHWKEVF
jgi:alpha 1,2-mannosyltransferase